MSRLTSQTKQQVILVLLVTTAVLAGLYFAAIRFQQISLAAVQRQTQTVEKKREAMLKTVQSAARISCELTNITRALSAGEAEVASGDLTAWMVSTIRNFKRPYPIEIPQFSTIVLEQNTAAAESPYQQVRMTVAGTAYYFDLGQFVADFENRYTTIRVQNLELVPASSTGSTDPEKLFFKMDIVAAANP